MNQNRRKVLIALDGSDQALNAVRYTSRILSSKKEEIVLFHVDTEMPEPFRDIAKQPESLSQDAALRIWTVQHQQFIERFMESARQIVVAAGFPEGSIKVKILAKKRGIARDIVSESHEGYSAVVAGRTGMSKLKDILMGSVATKLVGKIQEIPLIVVGGTPAVDKVLVAFDGSEGAMKSVACVGSLLADSDCRVTLCHIVRALGFFEVGPEIMFYPEHEREWEEVNRKRIEPSVDVAKKRLIQAGMAANRLSSVFLTGKASRAAGIVEEAKAGGYGTIVVGRRGLTIVKEFLLGRVSKKVLHLADEFAVWIVS